VRKEVPVRERNSTSFYQVGKTGVVWQWELERGPHGERYRCAYEAAATALRVGAEASRQVYETIRQARGRDLVSPSLERRALQQFVTLATAYGRGVAAQCAAGGLS
jgi:hypothetical protein